MQLAIDVDCFGVWAPTSAAAGGDRRLLALTIEREAAGARRQSAPRDGGRRAWTRRRRRTARRRQLLKKVGAKLPKKHKAAGGFGQRCRGRLPESARLVLIGGGLGAQTPNTCRRRRRRLTPNRLAPAHRRPSHSEILGQGENQLSSHTQFLLC